MQWLVPQLQLHTKSIGIAAYDVRVHFEVLEGALPYAGYARDLTLLYYSYIIQCHTRWMSHLKNGLPLQQIVVPTVHLERNIFKTLFTV